MKDFESGFNVRVYGVMLKEFAELGHCVLLSKEVYDGPTLVKFPGGGVDHCEAPQEALVREFQEEVGVQVEVKKFLYTSPNFHKSYFRKMQLIALYWLVHTDEEVVISDEPQPIEDSRLRMQQLYWQPLASLEASELSGSADQEVIDLLKSQL